MVRAFGINPKVGDSSPPQFETVFVSKTLTLSQKTLVHVSKMNAVARTELPLLKKLSYTHYTIHFAATCYWHAIQIDMALFFLFVNIG